MRCLRIAVALVCLGAGSAQAGLFDDDEARRRVEDLRLKSEARIDNVSRGLVDLSNQMQAMRDEMAKMRGQIETLTYELELTKKRQQDFYVDLDNRLRKIEPQAGGNEAAPKPAVDQAAVEGQEYDAALNLFKAGKYKEATAAFTAFVSARPTSNLAPSAQFWLGNAWYALRDCKRAIEAQNLLLSKWPNSPKAPDGLLAIATCQADQGSNAQAKRTLENLIAQYPDAPAAGTARQRLKKK